MYNFEFLKTYLQINKPYNKFNLERKLSTLNKVYIFGAGSGGTTTLNWLEQFSNINVQGFIDNDINKQGKVIEGKMVYAVDEIQKHEIILVASTYHEEICANLKELHYNSFIVLPIDLIIWDDFETIEWLSNKEKLEKIECAYNRLADLESKDIMIRTLLYRWSCDKNFIKQSTYPQYCSPQILNNRVKTIVDVGAFDGDTIKKFGLFFKNCKKIHAFEPTQKNYDKICALKLLENKFEIAPIQMGVWKERDTLSFFETDSIGGNNKILDEVTDNHANFINVIDLDTYFKESTERVDLIKMDIEGAEVEALQGMASVITKNRPVLEVCIYHKIEHYVEVIDFINDLKSGYEFYLGHHSDWMMETVLYAIPSK